MKNKRMLALCAGLVLAVSVLSIALGATLYQLNINGHMRLRLTTGLELRDMDGHVITAVDWGDFNHLETKGVNVTLRNIGNAYANTSWVSDCPGSWSLTVYVVNSPWITYQQIAPGAMLDLYLVLGEQSALGGLPYSFTLLFLQES